MDYLSDYDPEREPFDRYAHVEARSAVQPVVRCCCLTPDPVDCYAERYDLERRDCLDSGERCECGCHYDDDSDDPDYATDNDF